MSSPSSFSTVSSPSSALYRAVWRWHFFAGLFVAPFAIFLAVTGSLYLWKPQFEEWHYRPLFNVPSAASTGEKSAPPMLSPDAQLAAAMTAYPRFNAELFVPAPRAGRSAEVQFASPTGDKVSVFVDPQTGTILGQIDDATRPTRILHDLHGTLLAGTFGEVLVELAASWAFVLMVSGFYLWWPRPFTVRGFLVPRFGAGRRALLRDLHAVPAVWLAGLIVCLLATGVQWTPVAGKWSRSLAQLAGEWQPRETSASAHRSELMGGWSPYLKNKATAETVAHVTSTRPAADPHEGHEGHHKAAVPESANVLSPAVGRISLAQVMAIASERKVVDAYSIALPRGATGVYSIFSDRNRAFTRVYLHIDQYSGKVLADVRYHDFGRIAKFYTFGIIAHEGQLFGLANQILGMIACLGIILLAITGLAMWRSRRPRGELGAPTSRPLFQISKAAVVIAVCLAALLPLMAATLILLLVLDRFLGRLAFFKPQG